MVLTQKQLRIRINNINSKISKLMLKKKNLINKLDSKDRESEWLRRHN